MPTKKYNQTKPTKLAEGTERRLIHTDNLMMVLIDFDNGPQDEPDEPHSHPHEQTALVVEGEIILFIEGEEQQHLRPGDMYAVPPNKMHGIQRLTKKCRLADSFTPLREDFLA
jgi:quercetin dioxygenase-like cupin family protein